LLKKPFRAIILPQHRIPHQKRIRGLLLQALGDRCAHCRVCGLCRFWTLDRTTITGRSAVILRQHTTPFRPMIVPFDDLWRLVYQSLRNSSRHIRANFRASMRRSPDWGNTRQGLREPTIDRKIRPGGTSSCKVVGARSDRCQTVMRARRGPRQRSGDRPASSWAHCRSRSADIRRERANCH
jgi:hypothetical protein